MRMYDIIDKKKKGMELTADEISYVVDGYVAGLSGVCFLDGSILSGDDRKRTVRIYGQDGKIRRYG